MLFRSNMNRFPFVIYILNFNLSWDDDYLGLMSTLLVTWLDKIILNFLQVIFLALDKHIKNVACTYSLEHRSIDDLFDSVFHCLNGLLKDDKNIPKKFQELVFCIGTIQTLICQHMLKEEEQVHLVFCLILSG